MSQFEFPVIDPEVATGTDLANWLNAWVPALESSHAGETRPPYIDPGGLWVQLIDETTWQVNIYTGTGDVQIGTLNIVTGVFTILVGGKPPASIEDAVAYAIALG